MNSAMLGNNTFDNNEGFKGGRGRRKNNADNNTGTAGAAAGGAAGGAGLGALLTGGAATSMSNSASGNIEQCSLDNASWYCQLSQITNMAGMILYIIMIIFILGIFIYYVYKFFTAKRSVSKNK